MTPEQQKIQKLEDELNSLKELVYRHQHDGVDGTNKLRKTITLDIDQNISIGPTQIVSGTTPLLGTTADQYATAWSIGPDDVNTPLLNKSANAQVEIQHYPNGTQSFFRGFRKPIALKFESTTTNTSTTAGNSTVTLTGFNFTTDELTGGLINIYNSSGTHIETQTIASNTSTVITITGTWLASTSNAIVFILRPLFLGSAEAIWQRGYVQEDTAGGLRFGVGPTAGGQNGLLYMDATGDLYWRDKGGTSTKLN